MESFVGCGYRTESKVLLCRLLIWLTVQGRKQLHWYSSTNKRMTWHCKFWDLRPQSSGYKRPILQKWIPRKEAHWALVPQHCPPPLQLGGRGGWWPLTCQNLQWTRTSGLAPTRTRQIPCGMSAGKAGRRTGRGGLFSSQVRTEQGPWPVQHETWEEDCGILMGTPPLNCNRSRSKTQCQLGRITYILNTFYLFLRPIVWKIPQKMWRFA